MSNQTKIWTGVGQSYVTQDNSIDVDRVSSERYQLSIGESGESGDSNSGYESGDDSRYESGDSNSGYESGDDSRYESGDDSGNNIGNSNSGYTSGDDSRYNIGNSNSGYTSSSNDDVYKNGDSNSGYISSSSDDGYQNGYQTGTSGSVSNYGYESDGHFYENEIKGTDSDDSLTGILGNNIALKGGKGNDVLTGSNGNDKLEGGKGFDALSGGTGNDIVDGGKGKDILTGGMGLDLFELEGRGAANIFDLADIITDFQKGADILKLKDGLGISNINITQGTGIYASDTLLQIASTGQYLAVLKGVNAGNINAADFTFS
ncbi:calcium-binding protein [Microcoleus sp. B6-A1]|uniref:calcium-binding protein n=1 Tax=Microcoleus sp. B6-A1 TaxID=2818684 RepID=UPI002FD64AA4